MLYSPAAMHIPDGFLSGMVSIVCWILSIGVIAVALRRVSRDIGERQVPMMGVLAAAIFAGQMLNFAVAGGTSGHLLGATLATIMLGPWAAVIVMTCVVSVQALIFQDGGLLALGANLFNMAVIGVFVSYAVYHLVRWVSGGRRWGLFAGGALAAWSSIFVAALACGLQLAASGTAPANIALPAMAGIHAIIGLGEALITVGALSFVYASRRDLLQAEGARTVGGKAIWAGGIGIALLLVVVSPLASSHPDGLEWVAGQNGFAQLARGPLYRLIPNYNLPGIHDPAVATILAGALGVLLVMGVSMAVAYTRRRRGSAVEI